MVGKPKPRHAVVQPLGKPYRFIPLTRKQNAIVDAKDFEFLMQWPWHAVWNECTKSFYARRSVGRHGVVRMHHVVLDLKTGEEGDHINRNTLDNRRTNLRRATHSQNCCNQRILKSSNTNGFKGVTKARAHGKHYDRWRVRITVNGKRLEVGYFHSPELAAHAFDEAAKKYHGEFAQLNFSKEI